VILVNALDVQRLDATEKAAPVVGFNLYVVHPAASRRLIGLAVLKVTDRRRHQQFRFVTD
jgi:hypothetical protein